MNYPWLDAQDIQAEAHGLLTRVFGAGDAGMPCVDLDVVVYDYLCERESLSFDDECDLGSEGGDQVLGRMKPLVGKIQITADLKRGPDLGRYRFTLAHEIGHWVLHRPLFLAEAELLDLFATVPANAEMTSLNRGIFPDGTRGKPAPEEWQANQFAIELLLDPSMLRAEFVLRFAESVIARRSPGWRMHARTLREHSRRLASSEVNGRPPLCSVFGLSGEAMAIALEQRGYAVEEPPLF